MIRLLMLILMNCVLSTSCGRTPGSYPPPAQESRDLGPEFGGLGPFIHMGDPHVDDYLVRDFMPGNGPSRWAFVHPEMRFRVADARNLKFAFEFTIPAVTFRGTGPVTVSCAVNGKPLGSIHCPQPGDYRFEEPVPAGLVVANKQIGVTFDASPRWVSPEDGAQLSFLLRAAGFTQ